MGVFVFYDFSHYSEFPKRVKDSSVAYSLGMTGRGLVILSTAKNLKFRMKRTKYMYYVYMLTNQNNRVLYTGVTNDLRRRLYEHRNKLIEGFTKKYNVNKLVYYEITNDVNSAIAREKQIKGWARVKKNTLVESENPEWCDLAESVMEM